MGLQPGKRLRARNSTCEVIVVRASADAGVLSCDGVEMAEDATPDAGLRAAHGDMIELGKRYVDAAESIEVLCTKAGTGPLELGGVALVMKAAKPLPASD